MANAPSIIQLRVELRGTDPDVWRSIRIKTSSTLSMLHKAIQGAMGWTDSHLHQFEKNGLFYGPDYMNEYEMDIEYHSERKQLRSVFERPGEWLRYEYDFGDGWTHLIELEYWLPDDPKFKHPICIDGKRACPPEDCGGIRGYENLIEIMSDPENEEFDDMLNWIGRVYDPEQFSIEDANNRLKEWFQ